jgi:polyhydroxyalkanoate synthase subunit PhaC
LYLGNELAAGVMELAGLRLSLADVKSDAYIVGAVNDHIVPWHACYQSTRLLGGSVRYVLSSGGHIAGISWWQDWTDWAAPRAGELVPPPAMGSAQFPPLRDAPGDYVHG